MHQKVLMRLNGQYLGIFFTVFVLLIVIPVSQVSAEDVPRPRQQISQGVSPDDVICKEGFVLVWRNDGMPACVRADSVLKLIRSGWMPGYTIDKISILKETKNEVFENRYSFQFEFCSEIYNEDTIGVIISSDTEKIPVQIDPNIKKNECHQYGTQIHALSESSLKTSLFYEKDIPILVKDFEKKKMNLEDDTVRLQQKLMRLQDPNLNGSSLEEIGEVQKQINWNSEVIESCKDGVKTLRSLQ